MRGGSCLVFTLLAACFSYTEESKGKKRQQTDFFPRCTAGVQGHCFIMLQLSNDKKNGLFRLQYLGDYTTQLYGGIII